MNIREMLGRRMREGEQPPTTALRSGDNPKCIDISHWQDFPNFEDVAASGVIAMIHKATEGTTYIDPNRTENIDNAMAAGIACATYHWLKPGDAAEQIAFYLSVIDPVPRERVVIDYEEDGCTLDDLHEAVKALLADPRRLRITVYSGHLLKEQLGNNYDNLLASHTDLWLAQYTDDEPDWCAGTYPSWTLWQYSESGNVDGIDGSAVDLNRFDGNDTQLLRWISPAADVPIPEPDVSEVVVEITTPPNVRVIVRINEED